MPKLSRRLMLRGAGGVAIALPFLGAMATRRTARGDTPTPPRRFVVFFSANGTIYNHWLPNGQGSTFTLGTILEPLNAHKQDILVLSGVANKSAKGQGGNGHAKGMAHMLTCTNMIPEADLDTGFGAIGYAGGPSIDQAIAQQLASEAKYASLEFGVQTAKQYGTHPYSRMCYAAAQQPIPSEDNPVEAFNRLFGDFDADPGELKKIRTQRQSVLDFVADDFEALAPKLGHEDRIRVEQHLAKIRAIEKQLEMESEPYGESCGIPPFGFSGDFYKSSRFPEVGTAQMDLLVMALACDLTRVASLQWSSAQSGTAHAWLGINDSHHGISHSGDGDQSGSDKLTAINRWYAEQFAYLIQKMKDVPEGDGSLLDNTVIMWCSEVSKGNNHSQDNHPYVLAGRCGGTIGTGRHLVAPPGSTHSDLYVGLMQAMGLESTTFGDPAFVNGPLAGLAG